MDLMIHRLLNLGEFVIFKFQTVTNVNAVGEKCDSYFGNNTGGIIFYKCIVTANINYSTEHMILLYENPPLEIQGRVHAN